MTLKVEIINEWQEDYDVENGSLRRSEHNEDRFTDEEEAPVDTFEVKRFSEYRTRLTEEEAVEQVRIELENALKSEIEDIVNTIFNPEDFIRTSHIQIRNEQNEMLFEEIYKCECVDGECTFESESFNHMTGKTGTERYI